MKGQFLSGMAFTALVSMVVDPVTEWPTAYQSRPAVRTHNHADILRYRAGLAQYIQMNFMLQLECVHCVFPNVHLSHSLILCVMQHTHPQMSANHILFPSLLFDDTSMAHPAKRYSPPHPHADTDTTSTLPHASSSAP